MTAHTPLFLQAFPAACQTEAAQLLANMQHPRSPSPTPEPDKLLLGGQTIRLIRRQYGLAIARRPESLNPIQRAMFHCLHTRHHDGTHQDRPARYGSHDKNSLPERECG